MTPNGQSESGTFTMGLALLDQPPDYDGRISLVGHHMFSPPDVLRVACHLHALGVCEIAHRTRYQRDLWRVVRYRRVTGDRSEGIRMAARYEYMDEDPS